MWCDTGTDKGTMKDLGKTKAFHWLCVGPQTFYADANSWKLFQGQGEGVRCPRCKKALPQNYFTDLTWRTERYTTPYNATNEPRVYQKRIHVCGARLSLWRYARND